ncbi:hypothetical protein SLS53_004487 [Cytospora paraplurivora]|uniref:Uncharacterized protein n=1 Tax=Cytospora paraplurivora TaxID=2898453 RepID=A0AAN9YFM5_9PEZI
MALFSATLTTVGSGLYSLFKPGSSTGEWVGFQVITGFGRGIGLQMPIVAAQNSISQDELSPTMAFLVWCQYIGPAIFLALYNTVFDTSLKSQLREQAPNADATAIIDAGATGFRSIVEPQDLQSVLRAYTNSLDIVFYLVAGAGAVSWFAAWGMGWKDIREKNEPRPLQPAGLSPDAGNEKAVDTPNDSR